MTTARVRDAAPGEDLSAPDLDDADWLVVDVPGDLHRALEHAGLLPPLDHGTNNDAAAWVESREWWYRLRLPRGGRLVCEGLDTFATLYLDGERIGESRNMFRPFAADVEPGLLAICFHRPLDRAPQVAAMRKAQYGYGWDFAPRRPTVGAWQPVTVGDLPLIRAVRFRTLSLDPVRVSVEVDADSQSFRASVAGSSGWAPVDAALELELGDVALWSPAEPVLHELVVETEGALDRRLVGVRTIEVDRCDGMRFVVNGVATPVRGANWVPPDTALGATDPARVTDLLQKARAAGMNMLRVWGGGVYGSDHFYATCDRLGILVWQDFMFACHDYQDDDPGYLTEVEAEARHQVRRLRTHPSLALWCGNNEVELLAQLRPDGDPCPGRRIFYDLLPRVVAEEDGATPYQPTSPLPGADRHNWQVWHGVAEPVDLTSVAVQVEGPALPLDSDEARAFVDAAAPARYLDDVSAFASEYGLCGMASWQTLRRWTHPQDLVVGASAVVRRTSPGRLGPRNKLELLVQGLVGDARDLRQLVALTQLLQAEGLKVGVEHYRRRWPACGGSLVWQLNDCWPATSWALVDVDGRTKPAFDVVRRAYAATLLSFEPDGSLWVSTDVAVHGEIVVRCTGFDGARRDEHVLDVCLPAGANERVGRFAVAEPLSSYLYAEGLGVCNRQPFLHPKALVRPRANLVCQGLTVTADAFAFQVQNAAGECFELAAGESRDVATTDGLHWF